MSPSTPSRSTSPSTAATRCPPRSWRVITPPRTSDTPMRPPVVSSLAPARSPDADTSPPKVFASTARPGGTSTTRSTPLPASGSERSRPPSSTRVSTTTSPFSNAV